MKKILTVLLVLTLVMSTFAACGQSPGGQSDPPADDGINLADVEMTILLPSIEGQIYVSMVYGMLNQAEALGMPQPVVLGAGGYSNLDVQIKQVEDAVAAGKDIILIMPLSEEGMAPIIDYAVDAGVTVVEFGNQSAAQNVKARYRTNQIEIGKLMGEACVAALNGEGNVVMFNGPAGASWSMDETEGFHSVVDNHPGINILAEKWTAYDVGVSMNTMNDLLQTFPDIDYIYTAYDAYAEGALAALNQAGVTGEILLSTVNLTTQNITQLQSGAIHHVVSTASVQYGKDVVDTALALLNGENVPAMQHPPLKEFYADDVAGEMDLSDTFYPEGWIVP